jgi:hypothetical protein
MRRGGRLAARTSTGDGCFFAVRCAAEGGSLYFARGNISYFAQESASAHAILGRNGMMSLSAMLCDDGDDRWMETQSGLAIGPSAFVQRFTESGGHLRPRRGPSRKCARNTTEAIQ